MRDLEHGKSMPSGDAAAAAYFCGMYFYLFDFPWLLPCIVLCSLGRVYVHCHWFGDTVIGCLFGMLFTLLKLIWNLIVIEYIFTNLQMAKRTKKIRHLSQDYHRMICKTNLKKLA